MGYPYPNFCLCAFLGPNTRVFRWFRGSEFGFGGPKLRVVVGFGIKVSCYYDFYYYVCYSLTIRSPEAAAAKPNKNAHLSKSRTLNVSKQAAIPSKTHLQVYRNLNSYYTEARGRARAQSLRRR